MIPELRINKVFEDHRGTFAPLYFTDFHWLQSNISINPNCFTIRGLHFQRPPFAQTKLIKVIQGRILDFVLDLNDNNKYYSFNMWPGYELLVPRNYAHGFITLQDDTIVQYLVDNEYSPESEGSIVWTTIPEITDDLAKLDHIVGDIEQLNKKIIISDKDLIAR